MLGLGISEHKRESVFQSNLLWLLHCRSVAETWSFSRELSSSRIQYWMFVQDRAYAAGVPLENTRRFGIEFLTDELMT